METIFTNRKFIRAAIALVIVLSLFVLVLFINAIKSSGYIGGENMPTITVSGQGDVMATSDIATITVNLTKDGATTKEAQDALNTSIASTLAYLKTQNIADADIKSEYGGLNPKYAPGNQVVCFAYPCPQPSQKIIGYTATQSIAIKVRAVDSASDIRTGLANLGITDISGPDFTIDNPDTYNDQARAKAINDAKDKAEVLAKQLGVHLGKITSFSENGNGAVPMMYDAKAMSMGAGVASAPAPVLPKGQNKITSNVNITYEIK